MENGPCIDDFPIKTSIYEGFSMAMLNNQMVKKTRWDLQMLVIHGYIWPPTLGKITVRSLKISENHEISWFFEWKSSGNSSSNPYLVGLLYVKLWRYVLIYIYVCVFLDIPLTSHVISPFMAHFIIYTIIKPITCIYIYTWWLIPLRILFTLVIGVWTLLIPLITGYNWG